MIEQIKGELELAISTEDQVKQTLLAKGEKNTGLTGRDIVNKTGLTYNQVMQCLYVLQKRGEISIEYDTAGAQRRMANIILAKMEPISAVNSRIKEANVEKKVSKDKKQVMGIDKIPDIINYIQRKIAIEEARNLLLSKGFSPDQANSSVIFSEEPLAEQAIYLLSKLEDALKESQNLRIDLDAAKRDLYVLKGQNDEPKIPIPTSSD